jgi:hypothetical protein
MWIGPMTELPYWMQSIQALGPTVVAIVAAFIAGYIAWRQWRTAHDRLSFDLYEKRFAVYEAVKNIINTAYLHGGVTQGDLDAFYEGIRGAEFLFDGRTKNFVTNIRQMAWKASSARARRQRSETDKLIDEEQDILNFLSGQAEGLEDMFRPYLDLSKAGLTGYWPR